MHLVTLQIAITITYSSITNESNGTRSLRANYGTLMEPFVASITTDYLLMNEAIDIALCNTLFNDIHNHRMIALFGAMNDLLIQHSGNTSWYFINKWNQWKMKKKLMQIPTLKQIYINSTFILCKNNLRRIMHIFDEQQLYFIRGVDTASQLPWLLFIISTNIPFSRRPRQKVVIVTFKQNQIHSIIYSTTFYSSLSGDFTAFNGNHKIIMDNNVISIKQIIDLLNHDKVYNLFNVSVSCWMHRLDVIKRRKFCDGVLCFLQSMIIIVPIISVIGVVIFYIIQIFHFL